MKTKPGRVVRVTVTSKLPEFKDKAVIGKLVDKGATWDVFLKNSWITLNDEEYCISALKGRVIATAKDKIAKVIDEYRMTMPEYKVQIVKKIRSDFHHQGHHEPGINQLRQNNLTDRCTALEEEVIDVDDTSDTEDVVGGWNDRVTAGSSSRDTFAGDIDQSVKEFAVAKLRDCATNADVHRVREELRLLQANRKDIKVARYMPYTLSILGDLFDID